MKAGIRGLVWLAVPLLLIAALSGSASASTGSSSSAQPPATGLVPSAPGGAGTAANADDPAAIAFDEVSLGTDVSDEYAAKGVVFTDTFTTTDGANPTSPVLSGEPKFFGDIVGRFTIPGTTTPATVNGFSLDVGFIDDRNSVEITYYDAAGNQVGATRAQSFGINEITVTYRGIASFKVSAVEYEAAGFAIDNLIVHSGARGIHPTRMAMLGDSYSSGEGLIPEKGLRYDCGTDLQEGMYVKGTNVSAYFQEWTKGSCQTANGSHAEPKEGLIKRGVEVYKNLCHRHRRAYPNRIRKDLGVAPQNAIFVACSGAKTEDVLSRGQYTKSPYGVHGGEPQLKTAGNFAAGGAPDFVTIGIGGNDAGFSGIILHCFVFDCANAGYGAGVISGINGSVYDKLESTFSALVTAFPQATIVAFGYPSVIDDPNQTCVTGIKANEMAWLKYNLLPALNEAIKDAASEAGISYVDITAATLGHGICSQDAWVNGVRRGDDRLIGLVPKVVANESFHPNQKGHDAIAKLFLDHYTDGAGNLLFTNPPREAPIRVLSGPEVRVGDIVAGALQGCGKDCRQPVACIQACPITIQGSGFDPNSVLNATVHSSPVALGQVTADAAGNVDATFKSPAKLPPGPHAITLEGPGAGGALQSAVATFQVFPRGRPKLALKLRRDRDAVRVRVLKVRRAAAGARVDLVCVRSGRRAADRALAGLRVRRGAGCPFAHRRFKLKAPKKAKRGSVSRDFAKLFERPLRPGTTLRIAVSSRDRSGRSLDARIGSGGRARNSRSCIAPGQLIPARC